jgi:hypothetical protein
MKYKDNMTQAELAQFKAELQALEDAYAGAAEHDAKMQTLNPAPDEWEDPSDYAGMGWVGKDGRP